MWIKIKAFTFYRPRLFLFCLAFFYVVLAGLLIQLVFIPYIAPHSMDAGNGLLSGYDGSKFHHIALDASVRIKAIGWSTWSLKPEGQIVSGIASIFYTLIMPKPWVLLPLNGILHGIASLALFEIILIIVGNRGLAFLSALPFLLFPSSLLWNAQMHNENYAVPGVLLILYSWVYLADIQRGLDLRKSWKAILSLIIGSVLVWEVRANIMSILNLLGFLVITLIIILNTILSIKKKIRFRSVIYYIGLLTFIWVMSSPTIFNMINQKLGNASVPSEVSSSFSLDIGSSPDVKTNIWANVPFSWTKTVWLPKQIDSKFRDLSQTRAKFVMVWSYAGSQIDTSVAFGNALEVIKYIPRSLEIGFLAPFPSDWFTGGYKSAASIMRKESGAEMFIVYVCLLGLVFFLWHFRKKIEIWVIFLISTGMLIVYTCTVPNVGALYRFRYPYLMPLVCLGLSGVILFCQQIIHSRQLNKA